MPLQRSQKAFNIAAWIAQLLVAAMFGFAGVLKMTQSIPKLSAMMPWTGQLPMAFVRTMGAVDLAGAIGLTLPAILRIMPWLTLPAAVGCLALQLSALVFHLSRGEASVTPLNIALIVLLVFIVWVRMKKAPIT